MPIVTSTTETRRLLALLGERRVALASFCTENPWTTEAILRAATQAGRRLGVAEPPVAVGFTCGYAGRSNLSHYWACGDVRLGFAAAMGDLRVLGSADGPYAACRVFPHLDHGQPDLDGWLLSGRPDAFAIVMFDGGALPFDENIERTARYVSAFGSRVVVEGAVGELKEAAGSGQGPSLTTPEQARRFVAETGCDLIVPNVGTEHRAVEVGRARYRGGRARAIAEAVGARLVLHGASSLSVDDLAGTPHDGFVKVNVWTAIERRGAASLGEYALRHATEMLGEDRALGLQAEGVLGSRAPRRHGEAPDLDAIALASVRRQWVADVAGTLQPYFDALGYGRLAGGV